LGAQHFNELEHGLPGIPRALLAERLKRLQQVGVIERHACPDERKISYQLTKAGWDLFPVIESLTLWGATWAFGEPDPSELNPILLLWWMRDRVFRERLPDHRIVLEFRFREVRPSNYWLILAPEDISVCLKHPGYDPDVLLTGELAAFYKVWMGRMTLDEALREEQIALEGMPALVRAFPDWFALSAAAGIVRAAQNRGRPAPDDKTENLNPHPAG
jgi:hypothetical protein